MPLKVKSMLRRKDRRDSQSTIGSVSSQTEAAPLPGTPLIASEGYHIKNPKKELNHKLHQAVWKNKDEKLCQLVTETDRKGNFKHSMVTVDKYNRTALHLAACTNNLRLVDILLDRDGVAAMQIKDRDGNTPLYKAVECDRFPVLMRFEPVAYRSVNIPNNLGRTPFHVAALRNDVQAGDKLLDGGAFIDAKDNDGYTPLALAVLHNCFEFVDFLNKEDATADAFNEKGETPFILAVRAGNTEMIKRLLKFRMINIDLKDDSGKNGIEYAKELESHEISKVIETYCKENLAVPFGSNPPSVAGINKKKDKSDEYLGLPVFDSGTKLPKEQTTATGLQKSSGSAVEKGTEKAVKDDLDFTDTTSTSDDVDLPVDNETFMKTMGFDILDVLEDKEWDKKKQEEEKGTRKMNEPKNKSPKPATAPEPTKDSSKDMKREETAKVKESTPVHSRITPLQSSATAGLGFNYEDPISDISFSDTSDDELGLPMVNSGTRNSKKQGVATGLQKPSGKAVIRDSIPAKDKSPVKSTKGVGKGAIEMTTGEEYQPTVTKEPVKDDLDSTDFDLSADTFSDIDLPMDNEPKPNFREMFRQTMGYDVLDGLEDEEKDKKKRDEKDQVDKGNDNVQELLEQGWDSDSEDETKKMEKNNKRPQKPNREPNDDIKELLGQGWDSDISSEGVRSEEDKGKKKKKEPEQKMFQAKAAQEPIKSSKHKDQAPVKERKGSKPEELLEQGWDTEEEDSKEESEGGDQVEEEKKQEMSKHVERKDDVQELLEQGWDSGEEDEEEEEEKPANEEMKEIKKKETSSQVICKNREDDIKELLEQGWDSDDEEDEEEESEGGYQVKEKKEEMPKHVERKVDIQELLKQGRDSDEKQEEEEEVVHVATEEKKDIKKKETPSQDCEDDVKELLEQGWDSESEVEEEEEEVLGSEKKAVNTPQQGKKDDIQELLKQGWDSDTEETEEEESPRNNTVAEKPNVTTGSLPTKTPKKHSAVSSKKVTHPQSLNQSQMLPIVEVFSSTDDEEEDIVKKNAQKLALPKEPMIEVSSFSEDSQDAGPSVGKPIQKRVKKELHSANSTPDKSTTEMAEEGKHLLSLVSSPSSCDELIPKAQQYDRSFRKYEELYEEKRKLEIAKMDQEVEIRRLKYQLEQAEEEIQSATEEKKKLMDQLIWNENRISKELHDKQSLELSWKETEIQNKTMAAHFQQLKDELEEVKGLLVSEGEEKALKAAALAQQQELYETLRLEATKTSEQKTKMAELLTASDTTRYSLEAKLSELETFLATTNERLTDALTDKMQLLNDIEAAEKKAADAEARLQKEKDNSISKLQEKHSLELKLQELEIKQQSLMASNEQHKTELEESKTLLRMEQDQKCRKEMETLNQEELYKTLHQEMRKTIEEKAKLSGRLESLDLTKMTLESKISELEASLGAANERLAAELSSKVQLMKDIGETERRVHEKKAVLEEEKTRHFSIVEHLKADVKKAESEASAKLEQLMSVKEQLASTKMSKKILEKEVQDLKKEISSSIDLNAQMQERLKTSDRAYEEVDREREGLEEVIGRMAQEASAWEHELEETRKVAKKYQEVVEKAQETLMLTAKERDQALTERADLQTQMIDFEGKVNSIMAELNQYEKREETLQKETGNLRKSRTSLQDMATKLRSENVSLEHLLADEVVQRERAQAENKELKEIWESEVKAKHKLTEKIMELEMLQKNTDGSVSQEKRRVRKIVEQKGILEMKLETLQEKNGSLQRESGELKAGLKAARRRAKDFEDTLRSKRELDLNRSVDNSEVISLHKEITKLQEQLRREGELRVAKENRSRQLEQELQSAQRMLEVKQSEALGRVEHDNAQISNLTGEVKRLQDHIRKRTVSKVDFDVIRNELRDTDADNKKLAKEICDLRERLKLLLVDVDQLKMENEVVTSEAVRYKDLLELEAAKREKVAAKLDRTRAKVVFSESRLNMERAQTGRLLDMTYRRHAQKPPLTSTPLRYEPRTSLVDDDMVEDVRLNLDRSIADHKDTAPSFQTSRSKLLNSDVESHLDSIKRQYRL